MPHRVAHSPLKPKQRETMRSPPCSAATRSPKPSSGDAPPETLCATAENPSAPTSGRLFTEDSEICLLKAFSKLARDSKPPIEITPSTTQFAAKSLSGDFTQGQVASKLRGLRSKYRALGKNKSRIKTAHQRRVYEIGREIWGKEYVPRGKSEATETPPAAEDADDGALPVVRSGEEEEEILDLDNYPILMDEISKHFSGDRWWAEGLKRVQEARLKALNERWMMLHVEEAAVVAKRAQLVYELKTMILNTVSGGYSSSYVQD